MNRCLIFLIYFLFSITNFAQTTKSSESFTSVPFIEGKVVFIKEILQKNNLSKETNYNALCSWFNNNYGNDPFKSSIRYDARNFEIIIKSRVELLLPANTKGVREKMVLRYRINTFLFQDKYVIEITDLMYMCESNQKSNILSKIIKAEDFICDNQIKETDNLHDFKINTRKSTLFFVNELIDNFEKQFNPTKQIN